MAGDDSIAGEPRQRFVVAAVQQITCNGAISGFTAVAMLNDHGNGKRCRELLLGQ